MEENEMKEALDEVERESQPLPEAPASVNIKCWIEKYPAMFTFRGSKPSEVVIQADKFIKLAKQRDWKPHWDDSETLPDTPSVSDPDPDFGDPVCPDHKVRMVRREGKFGPFFSCPKNLPDGSWCPNKQTIT